MKELQNENLDKTLKNNELEEKVEDQSKRIDSLLADHAELKNQLEHQEKKKNYEENFKDEKAQTDNALW